MNYLRWVALALILIVLVVIGAGQLGLLSGSMPARLGVRDGRLAPPSLTPNSVSSQAGLFPGHPQQAYAAIAPLAFTGDGQSAMARLALILRQSPRVTVISQQADYIYAQATTPVLRFTDDLEFWLDEAVGVIQVRSASRLGRGDLGVNRARIEDIRARFKP